MTGLSEKSKKERYPTEETLGNDELCESNFADCGVRLSGKTDCRFETLVLANPVGGVGTSSVLSDVAWIGGILLEFGEEKMMDRTKVFFGQRIRINENSGVGFSGEIGYVAYIGDKGVSVYLADNNFDECIPLNWNEFDDASLARETHNEP